MSNWKFSYASSFELSQYYDHSSQYNAVGSYSFDENILTLSCTTSGSSPDYSVYMFPLSSGDTISFTCDYDLNSYGSSKNFFGLQSPSGGSLTVDNLTKSGNYYYSSTKEGTFNVSCSISNNNTFCFMMKSAGTSTFKIYNLVINDVPIDSDSVSIKYPYTFQNGYLFVFDLGNTGVMYSFDLSSKSEEYSDIGDNPFPDTNQSYWFDNSLPETDETTIPSSSAITIHWNKGDKTNIFGQTQDMVANINGTSSGRYLYIYNPPAHYKWSGSINPSASETINYPVTINGVSVGDNFYVYDSRALLFDFNQGGKVQGTVTGETGYGSVSSDGAITVVTSEGAIYTQNPGGSTDISGANGGSLAENINGLKQAFDDAINNIILLISTPVEYIQRLIGLGGEFVQSISSFFDFLPEPLNTMVITGISVVIVIGVLHTLL